MQVEAHLVPGWSTSWPPLRLRRRPRVDEAVDHHGLPLGAVVQLVVERHALRTARCRPASRLSLKWLYSQMPPVHGPSQVPPPGASIAHVTRHRGDFLARSRLVVVVVDAHVWAMPFTRGSERLRTIVSSLAPPLASPRSPWPTSPPSSTAPGCLGAADRGGRLRVDRGNRHHGWRLGWRGCWRHRRRGWQWCRHNRQRWRRGGYGGWLGGGRRGPAPRPKRNHQGDGHK